VDIRIKLEILSLRAWKDICIPKNKGGLGIKNLQAMNQALIRLENCRTTSFIWFLNPSTFLTHLFGAITPKSALWAFILKMLSILKSHPFYQITRGNILVSNTFWFSGWNHIYI
jgi:hypothetical protein